MASTEDDPLRAIFDDEDDEEMGDPIDDRIATFQGLMSQARRKLHIVPHLAGSELKTSVQSLASLVETARDAMDRVHEEVDRTPNASRYMRTVRLCDRELERLVARYEKLMDDDDLSHIRRHLMEAEASAAAAEAGERRVHLANGRIVEENASALDDVRMTLERTTERGGLALRDLKSQTETLKLSSDAILDTDGVLKESKRVLNAMARRAATNKAATALIVLFELIIIVFIIYYKWFWPEATGGGS